ncbi:dihydrolipoyl dehydrogenase [Clostridium sp. MSJ-11]|uniref:Dihydrolipoyl dehydrogenase n=1 Tax=Clostridium mobile TaxID=2841512 RepID=A0ABS6EL25_9CLOT|nr:dihydrolipoyl dehydrogenase [Clostridium mobile]MBU5485898.1 dihydrolipoyl dehydrogenase [Clostridium mobile]
MVELKIEKLAGHSKKGKVGKINANVGSDLKEGDLILQVECDKGNASIKSNCSGLLKELKVEEGDEVNVGDIVALIEGVVKTEQKPKGMDYFASMLKPTKREVECDLTVIGAGPGGYVAAIYAAKKGLKTVLVEKDRLGGTCLNVGCIPTKALVRSSEVFNDIKHSEDFGIKVSEASVDMGKVIDRKNGIVDKLVGGIDFLLGKNSIEKITGAGEIIDKNKVFVKGKREEVTINTKNIIIATGSKISKINIEGFDSDKVLNSTTALDMRKLPSKMVVIGGGVIGMEFAFIYANFGVDVTVVEYMPKVLCTMDDDVIDEIVSIGKEKGIKFYTSSKVTSVKNSEDGEAIVVFETNGEEKLVTCDNVIVAIGREPNLEGLGIEKVGIELNDNKKGIKVDDRLRTNVENIYAIGDVNNKIGLAHVASHGGMIAVDNILGEEKEIDYSAVPGVVYTIPEVATVGITENLALEKGMNIKVGKFPFMANGKALTYGEEKGFVKIIKNMDSNALVGASVVGPHASDLIGVLTLAIKNNLTEEQIKETIFAHPTTGEAIHEAALALTGGAIHFDI